jgi:WD40 repeat protein
MIEIRDEHGAEVMGLAWSPDGQRLASVGFDSKVRIWDANGKPLRSIAGHDWLVHGVAWKPDGSRLVSTGLGDFAIRTWNPETGEPGWFAIALPGGPTVTFSSHGRVIEGAAAVVDAYFRYVHRQPDGSIRTAQPSAFQIHLAE